MRVPLVHPAFVLAILLPLVLGVGCSCGDQPAGTCRATSECARGQVCIDSRCMRGADAGPRPDGGEPPMRDAQPSDAPAPDRVRAAVESAGREVRRPIDAIVLPDESPSMGEARDSVALAMETTFRTTMESAGVDYRVIWHGTTALPTLESTGRLTRNPVGLGSGPDAMFVPVLDTYDTWRPALRADALKVFVHFTDATSGDGGTISGYMGTFDEVLIAREPALWGSAGDYRFVYHAFVGLAPNAPPEAPYEPGDPIVSGSCSDSFVNPVPLQEMARRTGGLRFPLCSFDRFDAVFRRIAESAIDRATVACEIDLPEPPAGMTRDLATLAVRVRDASGGSSLLLRAMSDGECTEDGFLLEGDRVVLCPGACARVEADPASVLSVLTGCDPTLY